MCSSTMALAAKRVCCVLRVSCLFLIHVRAADRPWKRRNTFESGDARRAAAWPAELTMYMYVCPPPNGQSNLYELKDAFAGIWSPVPTVRNDSVSSLECMLIVLMHLAIGLSCRGTQSATLVCRQPQCLDRFCAAVVFRLRDACIASSPLTGRSR